jgi:YHS domain-containing protein
MIRIFIYLLLSIFAITLLRMFIGIAMKGFSAYVGGGSSTQASSSKGTKSATSARSAGVLRKDSYSGVYITEESAVKRVINGEVHYFASEENVQAYLRQSRS